MAGVIKGGFYGNSIIINGEVDIDNGSTPVSVNRTIKSGEKAADQYTGENFGGEDFPGTETDPSEEWDNADNSDNSGTKAEIKAQLEAAAAKKQQLIAEGQAEKDRLVKDGAAIVEKAKAETEKLVLEVKKSCEKMHADAELEAKVIRENAGAEGHSEGFEQGYAEGEKVGREEGYLKGLAKCKDTLIELKAALEAFEKEKEAYFKSYERQIFETIFDIAQKITLDSLKQKDKAVLQKMLKQAAKEFLNSENVRITLSALDISEEAGTSLEVLRSCFKDNQHVEFEVLKDAPSGTLIIDNGKEITDAGIPTQLKMIGELGKGKYRDKPDSNPPKAAAEAVEEPAPVIAREQTDVIPERADEDIPEIAPPLDEMSETQQEEAEIAEAAEEFAEPEIVAEYAVEEEAAPKKQEKKPKAPKPAEESKSTKRPRKATNPLLSKMMGKLENNEE